MTVAALAAAIRRGELSPREAVQAALDADRARRPRRYNSFLTVRGDEALAEADALRPARRAAARRAGRA